MCIRDRPCSPPSFRSLSKTKTTAEHGMSHQTRWSGTHNNVTRAPCCVTRLMRKGKVGECLMANDTRDRTRELQHKLYRAAKESPTRRFHALYDKVHRADVLGRAWSEVAANGGAPGVDGVSITQVQEQGVEDFLDTLRVELETGCYRPLPVRRVTIPKASGGTRNLGVPAVRDRVVQAAAKLVCEPIFEADFLDCSYGFRPKRSAQQALEAIRVGVNGGRTWVVDADIASFFDSIPREVLRSALAERISDRRMMKLLMGWLRAGVWTGETLLHPQTGTAQGGVISPLMANVVLHQLDRRWRQRCLGPFPGRREDHQIVREADDLPQSGVLLAPSAIQLVQHHIGHQGTDHPALGGPGLGMEQGFPGPYPGPQPPHQQLHHPPVADPLRQRRTQHLPGDRIEEAGDVGVDHPGPASIDSHPDRFQRLLR